VPRVALYLIIAAALVTCGVFAAIPRLDVDIAGYFHRPEVAAVTQNLNPIFQMIRSFNNTLVVVTVALALGSIAFKVIWPRGPMLMPARAALLIIGTFALGPALLANGVLKTYGSRPRPMEVTEIGGTLPFVQWWDPRGACDTNCSFVSGEASSAYAMVAPAVALPPPWRIPAIGAALLYGSMIGLVRMARAGHFLSDVIFAGILTVLIVWLLHGLLYRWRRTRLSEQRFEKAGLAIRSKYAKQPAR
jgi:lipid A 4'-phosphatase